MSYVFNDVGQSLQGWEALGGRHDRGARLDHNALGELYVLA